LIHAATMVNAGVYLVARFSPAFSMVPGWLLTVTIIGMLSALLAGLGALAASDLKKALAFSTVSQLGFMFYAVGAGDVFAAQFHLVSHAVFKALLFLSAGAVIHSVGTRDMRRMGGLGLKMPYICNVFMVGALALCGIPLLNGFWSKELILEAGHANTPGWVFGIMLFCVGLTALYTLRMVWLVFLGEPREELHVHSTGAAMKIAVGILAFGVFTTWLLAGIISSSLSDTLLFHKIEPVSLQVVMHEVVFSPWTWLSMLIIAIGFLSWFGFHHLEKKFGKIESPAWFTVVVDSGFGLNWLNDQVIWVTQKTGSGLQLTQTGNLNWNMLGILAALIIVLGVLVWGA
ncbi:MAG: proton-conducting transporter membrane subunit, partial [Chloroflexota bacterium]